MVTPAAWRAVSGKLEARLSPTCVSIYSQGFNSTADDNEQQQHPGMALLGKLRDAKKKVDVLGPLATALHSKDASALDLLDARDHALA
eukprot:12434228-Alexandrium_andersonii.AAC.1